MGLLRRRTPPSQVTLVTRAGCTLCAEAEPLVRDAAAQAGVAYDVRDVDTDVSGEERARWTDKVPVVLLDGVEHAYWQIDSKALRRALKG
jgi:glutaredoxin